MTRFLALVLLTWSAVLLGACATPGSSAGGDTITGNYNAFLTGWDSGPRIYVFVAPKEINGKLGVCGAWTVEGDTATVSDLHRQAMAGGQVRVDGRTVVQNLNFMNRIDLGGRPVDTAIGQPSRCVVTDRIWVPAYANGGANIQFPRMRFVI